MGRYYCEGKSRNCQKAIGWYLRAIALSPRPDMGSCFQIGWCHEKLHDREQALLWYRKATELGDVAAKQRLEEWAE